MRTLVFLIAIAFGPLIASAQSDTISGTWSGGWHEGGTGGPLVLRLTQSGENVHGDYDSGGGGSKGDIKGLRLFGTLKGDRLVLKTRDDQRGFEGTVKGNTITGRYSGKFAAKAFSVKRTEQ